MIMPKKKHQTSSRQSPPSQMGSSGSESETSDEPVSGFICPHCRYRSDEFNFICPECGRPYMRDFIDWRMYPRDPELRGTLYYNPFWARIWLALTILGLVVAILVVITWSIY